MSHPAHRSRPDSRSLDLDVITRRERIDVDLRFSLLEIKRSDQGVWGATEHNAELRIMLQIPSTIKSRVTKVRHCHSLERQELCRLSYSGFY
jgi:hypothetical protein